MPDQQPENQQPAAKPDTKTPEVAAEKPKADDKVKASASAVKQDDQKPVEPPKPAEPPKKVEEPQAQPTKELDASNPEGIVSNV